ncbi:hypothetical protein L0337_43175 [candidate division KSB1 bacterium]|nr:hypothetical protein [candidate division KSB1 bacterium]
MSTHDSTSKASRKKKNKDLPPLKTASSTPNAQSQVETARAFSLRPRDDLLNIEGIDPTMEMALNSIGIHRYSDFRGYSPESLAQALLGRTGISVSVDAIASRNWIGWAEILAAENPASGAAEINDEKASEETTDNSSHAEALCATPNDEKAPQPVASTESENNDEETLAGPSLSEREEKSLVLAPEKVAGIQKSGASVRAAALNGENEGLILRIQNAGFAQVTLPATPDRSSTKFLRAEIDCGLTGRKASMATAEQAPLCAQIHAVDKVTGEPKLLASRTERLQANQTNYRLRLEFEAPKTGRYQLQIVAFLLHPIANVAFYQGPSLRVIP